MPAPITIDADKCKKDGLCVRVCPWVFEQADKATVPTVAFPGDCILCGHCVAVCSTGALTLHLMDRENFPPIDTAEALAPETLHHLLRMRRSVRQYKSEPVPRERLEALLDAARYAPTGHNARNLCYIVVQDPGLIHSLSAMIVHKMQRDLKRADDPDALAALDPGEASRLKRVRPDYQVMVSAWEKGEDPILYHAPVLVVIHAPRKTPTPVEDATLAASHLMLMAEACGLGTCLIGWFYHAASRDEAIRERLGIPPTDDVYMAITLGYPAVRFRRLVDRPKPAIHWMEPAGDSANR